MSTENLADVSLEPHPTPSREGSYEPNTPIYKRHELRQIPLYSNRSCAPVMNRTEVFTMVIAVSISASFRGAYIKT
jgi:hypothetical protein